MDQLNNEIKSLKSQISTLESKNQQLNKYLSDYQANRRGFVDEIQSLSSQIDSLKFQNKALEKENTQLKKQITLFETSTNQVDETEEELEKKDIEIENLQKIIEEFKTEKQALEQGIHNMEVVNDQSQQKIELLELKYQNELKRLYSELEILKSSNFELEIAKSKVTQLSQKLSQSELTIKHLETEHLNLKQQNNQLLFEQQALQKRLKQDSNTKEFLVTKVITKFIINLFDQHALYAVKMQMLETLSSILQFNDNEKKILGIYKIEKKESENQKNQETTLKDRLAQFLMEEDDEEL